MRAATCVSCGATCAACVCPRVAEPVAEPVGGERLGVMVCWMPGHCSAAPTTLTTTSLLLAYTAVLICLGSKNEISWFAVARSRGPSSFDS